MWGLPTSQISSKQAQRVAKLNLKNIILRALGIKADPATYFTKYMYPRKGISMLYEGMAGEVRDGWQCVLLESPVVRLERDGDRIARVVYHARTAAKKRSSATRVLSTLPLPQLVQHDAAVAAGERSPGTRRGCAIAA